MNRFVDFVAIKIERVIRVVIFFVKNVFRRHWSISNSDTDFDEDVDHFRIALAEILTISDYYGATIDVLKDHSSMSLDIYVNKHGNAKTFRYPLDTFILFGASDRRRFVKEMATRIKNL